MFIKYNCPLTLCLKLNPNKCSALCFGKKTKFSANTGYSNVQLLLLQPANKNAWQYYKEQIFWLCNNTGKSEIK